MTWWQRVLSEKKQDPEKKIFRPGYARERVISREYPPISINFNEFEVLYQIVFSENEYQNAQGFPFCIYTVPPQFVYIVDTAFLQWQFIGQISWGGPLGGAIGAQIQVRDPNNISCGYLVQTKVGAWTTMVALSLCSDPVVFVYPTGYIIPTGHSIWLTAGSDEFEFDFIVHGYLAKPLRQLETFYNGGNQGYPTV